jgi:hypothetical protein
MGLEGEERSTNAVPIKEACDFSLEENTLNILLYGGGWFIKK